MSERGRRSEGELTQLLALARQGDRAAEEQFYALVYDQLHRLASSALRKERSGHTMQTTDIVHEAYLRLTRSSLSLSDRLHFFRIAAKTMRRILVDHARRRSSKKRGSGLTPQDLECVNASIDQHVEKVLQLDEALSRLEKQDQRVCKVVEMRFFAGLSIEETADALGVSSRTIKRDWEFAKSWLHAELE